ncbi:MAG: valyl-tRNA synthetase, partial [Pseudonocardiales bacterium]|nr:valyl-tRNA synthetase [Pseudonocardiales bacterium]
TSVLVTGYDILFFWVARMMMLGLYAMDGTPPFEHVFLHGLIRDQFGKKMSKSRGNTIDPLALMDTYGADALRFTLARGSNPGSDMSLSEEWVAGSRNFGTKLWNAARFALANGADPDGEIDPAQLTDADRWILDRVGAVTAEVDALLEDFQFAKATELLYHFTWDEFCDWYLELAKVQIGQSADGNTARAETTRAVLGNTLDVLLRLLHPIMPFLTETLWTALTGEESLVVASWPRLTEQAGSGPDTAVAERIAAVQKLVTEVRRFRADQGLRPGQWVPARLAGADSAGLGDQLDAVRALARLGAVEDGFTPTATVEVGLAAGPVRVELDTSGTIDLAAERARLTKDLAVAEKELSGTEAKLGNPKFTERAPADVVAGIAARREAALADIERIRAALTAIPEG